MSMIAFCFYFGKVEEMTVNDQTVRLDKNDNRIITMFCFFVFFC